MTAPDAVEALAAALNDAQLDPSELRLGHDLRVPAKRIADRLAAAGYRIVRERESLREALESALAEKLKHPPVMHPIRWGFSEMEIRAILDAAVQPCLACEQDGWERRYAQHTFTGACRQTNAESDSLSQEPQP